MLSLVLVQATGPENWKENQIKPSQSSKSLELMLGPGREQGGYSAMWPSSFRVSASKCAGTPHPMELSLRKFIAKTNTPIQGDLC